MLKRLIDNHLPFLTSNASHPASLNMDSSSIPLELIEAIIDEVGVLNDVSTLRACSLVCSAFVFRSQTHLFRTIDLDKQVPRKQRYDRFHRLLINRPHLGTYVRQLRLGDDSEDDFEGGRGRGGNSWIAQARTLPLTLQMLPRLEGFSLSFNSEMTHWKSIQDGIRTALGKLFRLPSLRAVSLEFITEFPPQLLLSLVRLQHLGLSCVEVDTSSNQLSWGPSHLQARWETRLRSLFLRGTSPPTIDAISQALATSSSSRPTLRKLSITPTFENGFCEATSLLIKTAGMNVTTFEWLPSIHFFASSAPITLAAIPYLNTLRFIVSFRKTHNHGPFHEILSLLSQLSKSTSQWNAVSSITFECHCLSLNRHSAAEVRKTLQADWRPVDKVMSRTAFANLREVNIILSASTSSVEDRKRFTLAFQDLLPAVEKKGVSISVRTRKDIDERFLLEEFRV